MKQTMNTKNTEKAAPLPTDTPLQIAVEARLRALLARHTAETLTEQPLPGAFLPTAKARGAALAYYGAALIVIGSGKVTLKDAGAADWGLKREVLEDGRGKEVAALYARRQITRARKLLTYFVIRGVEARGEA